MKKLLIFVIAAVIFLVAFNYVKTGTLRILPAKATPASQRLDKLAAQFHELVRRYDNAARSSGAPGPNESFDAGAVRLKVLDIQQNLDQLSLELTTPGEREDADHLKAEIKDFLAQLQ